MKKIILLVLDGVGINNSDNGNVMKMANIPNINKLMKEYPYAELDCCGESVGLPRGLKGNTEVGHMTIGCGRAVEQPLLMINNKIKDKTFFENDKLLDIMDHVNENNSTLHFVGLISNSGIHASIDHFYASLALAKIRKVKSVVFHFITDGKDTNADESYRLIKMFMEKAGKLGLGTIGTICGRYYSLDNEGHYDRIKKSYDAMIYGIGNNFSDYAKCLELHYKNGISDEYVNPSVITKGSNITDNDAVLFLNYRPEMMNELITSFSDETFNMFNTKKLKNVKLVSLYGSNGDIDCVYNNETIDNSFGKYLADLEFKQTRIAESCKYLDVTYFFDGAEELSDTNLYKIMVPSPKVERYDIKPEMNALGVTESVINAIEDDFDFILVNFANPDIVAHTGNIPATIKAIETCDVCIGEILEKATENFYDLVITSDHGNIENMKDENGKISLGHTENKVPFIICNKKYEIEKEGKLSDVIPTIIDMYEISKPKEMTGNSLIIKKY